MNITERIEKYLNEKVNVNFFKDGKKWIKVSASNGESLAKKLKTDWGDPADGDLIDNGKNLWVIKVSDDDDDYMLAAYKNKKTAEAEFNGE